MKRYSCDAKMLRTAKLFLAVIFVVLLIPTEYFLMKFPVIMWIIVSILSAVTVFLWFFYFNKYFENYEVIIQGGIIKRRSGFFIFKESIMPLAAIQYVTVATGNVFTKLGIKGLNIVLIFAYGGIMYLPFLSVSDTIEIKEHIDRYISKEAEISETSEVNAGKMGDINVEI